MKIMFCAPMHVSSSGGISVGGMQKPLDLLKQHAGMPVMCCPTHVLVSYADEGVVRVKTLTWWAFKEVGGV